MKKRNIVIIIIIWILLLTGIILYSKYNNQKKETTEPEIKEIVVPEKETLDKYEYIDYTGYYDENDLKTEKKYLDEEKHYEYIEISGLKDKNLEKSINKKLYDLMEKGKEKCDYLHSNVSYNANNILSAYTKGYCHNRTYETLNIDLTTGEKLEIEDIVNTTNLIGPIANAYYNLASYQIGSQIKKNESTIQQIQAIDGYDERIEELKNDILEYQEMFKYVEDDSIKYARNFDKKQNFYITSAGIIIPEIEIYDFNGNTDLFINVKNNPRLFNYYYKYKTNTTIFDGTYSGKKNLIIAQYYDITKSMIKELEDYAIIDYDDESILEQGILDNYINTLDKNSFSYIYDVYSTNYDDNHYTNLTKCTMSKELYNNTVKYELADAILKAPSTQGHYSIKNENATCEYINIYNENPNVTLKKSSENEIIIINDEEKTKEINEYIENKLKEFLEKNNTRLNIKEVTKDSITIEITSYEIGDYDNKIEILETINLK